MIEIEPGYEPCRICAGNAINGAQYCDCEHDEHGNVTRDCGQCSNGIICANCNDHFGGLDVSISAFY